MAQAAAPAANAAASNAVVAFTEYPKYKILVPGHFSPDDSEILRDLQEQAIQAGAVSGVRKDTMVNMAAWTNEASARPCIHINFCPISRGKFDYLAFSPLSLVEECGFVIAGVCVTSIRQISQLRQDSKLPKIPNTLDDEINEILRRLESRFECNRVHQDHEDTLDCSLSTTSGTYLPHTSKPTTEAREESPGAISQRRRRNNEWDSYAAEAPEPKRAHTAPTSRPSSESALKQSTITPSSIPTAVPNLWADLGLGVKSSADA
ncbi:hypothetical protein PtrSN002B_010637 [Pyrenophora tritici-repentis]|uniref:Uncharacterized protein n=2 Tax=Pyrenophora tritici-repentis TaxID=45151 RepID=A0A922SRN1_9PLEO|nr:uncharacterized protein PTRG_11957 [Pyrenophora tritici-repentis Pt-1C-BFP]EDU46072.1 predicted protein [Pyrenophora tritici-repentis Pt-1C-BFP]KAI1508049.1 hypothetical protein Ptr86124_012971 [Pyrenophora tritici-repentis]KAI1532085.1 hypothetical protein PtrSN002B_010637 [Pyrenophora tritici-repentis]KAI1690379.1 hypothetical protein KJE20_03557 [Pyrenophora tritici-repentis]